MDTFSQIIQQIDSSGIDYMIVGSIASSIYGEPRTTRDIDFVLQLTVHNLATLRAAFPEDQYYFPPSEIITSELINTGYFNLLHHMSGIKVDITVLKPSEFAREEFSRRVRHGLTSNLSAWIASPEDIVLGKLRFYTEGKSEKHLVDILSIIANQNLDLDYIRKWVINLGIQNAAEKVGF